MVYHIKINYFLELNYINFYTSIEFFKNSIRKLGKLQWDPKFIFRFINLIF
jgi:hypothetical protein